MASEMDVDRGEIENSDSSLPTLLSRVANLVRKSEISPDDVSK